MNHSCKNKKQKNSQFSKKISNGKETCSAFLLKASLTIEAALCMPFIILAILAFIRPLKLMEAERMLHNHMEACAKNLAVAAYVKNCDVLNNEKTEEYRLSELLAGIGEGAAQASILLEADTAYFSHAWFDEQTTVLKKSDSTDENMIVLSLSYTPVLPLRLGELTGLRKTLVVNRRAWTGSDGGRGRSKYGDEEDEEEDDPIVYIGRDSTRYHLSPGCHYLSNQMRSADASQITALRNSYGGKYHACPSCKPKSGTVFYFENGSAYHGSEHCKAINAYVREAHLSEVRHLGCCSYCQKHYEGG